MSVVDIHTRGREVFLYDVHSFELWFQSVDGYLGEPPHGVWPDTEIPVLDERERDALISIHSTYCVGEVAALDGASGMVGIALNQHTKLFLATHLADEARHLEVSLHRRAELGRQLVSSLHSRSHLHKQELDPLLLSTFEENLPELGVSAAERPDVGRLCLETVKRLGFDS